MSIRFSLRRHIEGQKVSQDVSTGAASSSNNQGEENSQERDCCLFASRHRLPLPLTPEIQPSKASEPVAPGRLHPASTAMPRHVLKNRPHWLQRLEALNHHGCTDGHISELLANDKTAPVTVSRRMVRYWRSRLGLPRRPGVQGFASPVEERLRLSWRIYASNWGWGHLLPGFCEGVLDLRPFKGKEMVKGPFEQEADLSPREIDILNFVEENGRATARDMKHAGCRLKSNKSRIAGLIRKGLLQRVGSKGRGPHFQVIYALADGLFRHSKSLRPNSCDLLFAALTEESSETSENIE